MELLKAIYQRRAVRDYSDAEMTAPLVQELLRAAVQAPSTMNQQPWAFAVFHGRARIEGYSRRVKAHLLATTNPMFGQDPRIDQYADITANLFHGADTIIVICAKPSPFPAVDDCYLAAENLLLAAHGLGQLEGASIDRIFGNGLHEFLGNFISENNRLGNAIAEQYLF